MTSISQTADFAAELIAGADALIVAAGAGIGVDSGLPDFRGNEGFWKSYPALGKARLNFVEVASPWTFRSNPRLAWGFYGHRLALYRHAIPHDGFAILRRWAQHMSGGAFVFTSNVDGHFQKAGFASEQIHECHGSIHWLQCLAPCCGEVWPADGLSPQVDDGACRWLGGLPVCPRCGGLARPNILMFGDGEWLGTPYRTQESRLTTWLRGTKRPVVVELGAGTHIPSVRYFSEGIVRGHNGRLIRINPREPAVSGLRDVGLALGALEGLRVIDASLRRLHFA